ncbi:hypothetical protein [Pedobacter suwonensis]|uniref:hypothetical protein n=1 Tax=Pedobacter suwonensis TaxID=332999 RepID=UPI00119FD2C7|nr:hypothetical protein [Pedobacter suwonensis]
MENDYKKLLHDFIAYKLNNELVFGFGGNEDGEYSCLTLNELNTDNMLTLKLYENQKYTFENEFWDDEGNPIRQVIYLNDSDLKLLTLQLQSMMQTYLTEQLSKYNKT